MKTLTCVWLTTTNSIPCHCFVFPSIYLPPCNGINEKIKLKKSQTKLMDNYFQLNPFFLYFFDDHFSIFHAFMYNNRLIKCYFYLMFLYVSTFYIFKRIFGIIAVIRTLLLLIGIEVFDGWNVGLLSCI
jgi:hypothetical protein